MGAIQFNQTGHNKFETGDDHGVLFVMAGTGDTVPTVPASTDLPAGITLPSTAEYANGTIKASAYKAGVAWLGLTAVTKSPSGADETELWADNIKYGSMRAAEKFGATIESYTYPEEFEECDGGALSTSYIAEGDTTPTVVNLGGVRVGQQSRKKFGFVFRSRVGDDQNPERGYKYHFVYNASASPSEQSFATVNDSPDAITFSHEISADAVAFFHERFKNLKPTCELTIDTTILTETEKSNFEKLRVIVYGRDATTGTNPVAEIIPQLPCPDDILAIMTATGSPG